MISQTAEAPRASISSALDREAVVWLGTVRPDGSPHVVPSWFLWDGDAIIVFSKPYAQKVRNIRADARVMVAVGRPDGAFDVDLADAAAELLPTATARMLPSAFAAKYTDLADRAGIGIERFAATYSQPIRLHPRRWLGWGGPGW